MNTLRMLISVAGIVLGALFLRVNPGTGFNFAYPQQALVALLLLTIETSIGLLLISTGVFYFWRRNR
jgi:hypothetical protein